MALPQPFSVRRVACGPGLLADWCLSCRSARRFSGPGTLRNIGFSGSAQTFSASGHQLARRVGHHSEWMSIPAARRATLERRCGRRGPGRARPSRWAGHGRERRAEARAVRRGVSGSSGSALGDEGDQLDVAPAVGHSSGNSSPTRDISLAQAIRA